MTQPTDLAALDRILTGRHSCRAFLPKPVPRETIEDILRVAQKTASWNNTQPWQAIVTSGQATEDFRKLMVEAAIGNGERHSDFDWPREYVGTSADRRRACGFQLYDAVGVARGDKAAYARQTLRNYELFDAPHVAIITAHEPLGVYGAVDCGAYVTNVMSAAEASGVATIAQAALAVYAGLIRRHFDIPADRSIVCGIAFGYEDKTAPVNGYRTPRAPLDEVVRWVE